MPIFHGNTIGSGVVIVTPGTIGDAGDLFISKGDGTSQFADPESLGLLTDAPADGNQYARQNASWQIVVAIIDLTADYVWTGLHSHNQPIVLRNAHFGMESVMIPAGTTQTWKLTEANHQTLRTDNASGDLTITMIPPLGTASGRLIVGQGATPRSLTFTNAIWVTPEPTWADDANLLRIISWTYDGNNVYLMSHGGAIAATPALPVTFDHYVESQEDFDNLPALQAGQSVGFMRGIVIRGILRQVVNDIRIGAYGNGLPPIISAMKAAGAWSQNGTYPAVYEQTWDTSQILFSTARLFMLVDGNMITRVADLATCAATPGSYYNDNTVFPTPSTPIYYHPMGSTDPNVDGRSVEITAEDHAIFITGQNTIVSGVEMQSGAHDGGPFKLMQGKTTSGQVVHPQSVSNLLATYGTTHNVLIGSGTLKDSCLYLHDDTIPGKTNGICGWYEDEVTNCSIVVENVHIIATESLSERRSGWSQPFSNHGIGSTYASVTMKGITLKGTAGDPLLLNGDAAVVDGIFIDRCKSLPLPPQLTTNTNQVTMARILADFQLDETWISEAIPTGRLNQLWTDLCIAMHKSATNGFLWHINDAASTIQLDQACIIAVDDKDRGLINVTGGGTVDVITNGCIIYPRGGQAMNLVNSWTGARNIYIRSIATAEDPGWDGQTNLVIDRSNVATYLGQVGESTTGNSHDDCMLLVETIFLNGWTGLKAGDFRLSAAAQGLTFPDGDTVGDHLATIGAQSHWDFNQKAVVNTAPPRWPVGPRSLSDCRQFILNPAAWDFYP